MCTCASCSYTDGYADKSFAEWPRGNPAGKRRSDADYSAHVRHLWEGVSKSVPFTPGQPAKAPALPGLVHPVQPNALAIRWNTGRKASPAEAEPARPAQPGKAERHLPAVNRHDEPEAKIYDMAKARKQKETKRGPGRPAIGKPYLIRLEEEHVKAAIRFAPKRGNGEPNLAEGVRRALLKAKAG